ncbi:MAG: fatty acid cis/trans isomerase [Methyloceanibacter sp.]|uniref:fatty acid cis/trans isomerase n=1 Tax=Methyloceanibacter sp. TaxID=1965321 RepID=UPI003EE2BE04
MILLLVAFATSGPAQPPVKGDGPDATTAAPSYTADIQPIFNKRCVACHGCLGSPCNLKLTSYRAAERGAFGENPYASHLEASPRTGMDLVQTTAEWRKRGFYPVLSRGGSELQNLQRSLLYQMIEAGTRHNKPGFSRQALMPLYAKRYAHQCPATPEALGNQLKQNPAAGMPFGLPSLNDKDFQTLRDWVASGSPGPTEVEQQAADTVTDPAAVLAWEDSFNADDKRSQLVARYIFDHVFLATIVLDESPGDYFKLVRSKTPPGDAAANPPAPVEIIDAPLPYSDPYAYAGVDRFYYRLKKITAPIVQKNHFVWRLGHADIDHLKKLFLDSTWDDRAKLDAPWGIGNPFLVFQAIPAEARYRFLLENSELIVSGITYGPVCLGQTATFAVKDQFWVYFVDPKDDVSVLDPKLGLETWNTFMDRSIFGNDAYEAAYGAALQKLRPKGYTIDAIWNGERKNPNAWLTVLRHESNVSVMKGRQGGIPRTQWLMNYSGFERIYYDTVASFEYWSGDIPKLETLVFFNYLRQEFEDNFLLLLPEDERQKIREDWTRGIGQIALDLEPFAGEEQPTQVKTDKREPLLSLVDDIQAHLGEAVSGPPDRLNPHVKPVVSLSAPIESFDGWVEAASLLTQTRAYKFPRYLPSVILLKLTDGDKARVYSLIANRVYASQDTILFQDGQALPHLYTMSIYPTVIGGFPNYFMEMDLSQANDFLRGLRDVRSLADWNALRDRYGILRNDARLWATYDWFAQWNAQNRGIEAGYLDLSYYDLFDSVY